MKIKEIVSQHRRDFTAIYECESCGQEDRKAGYDDDNFHRHIIPSMQCPACLETAPDNYRPLATKYAASEVV